MRGRRERGAGRGGSQAAAGLARESRRLLVTQRVGSDPPPPETRISLVQIRHDELETWEPVGAGAMVEGDTIEP